MMVIIPQNVSSFGHYAGMHGSPYGGSMTRGAGGGRGIPPAYNQHQFHAVPMFPGAQNANQLQSAGLVPHLPGYRSGHCNPFSS